ncbi:hypothetical protein [Peptoniphilus lacrimalis]|uniref:Uncharacterized protein n=1 Tax=Peptoniphilus lacrimalis 315-B TaxID=596330 RepID=D1VRX8_9FIRM|nr:hypothetical protein [Peptoniphilus lacrimalis]EFA90703.1 hypothetical protein HMPREF0628_1567 [Peptoniphilus lacrimalis 315-B]
MDNKEIILSKIAEILSRKGFFFRSNSEFKSRLKCVGLGEYFDKYSDYLIPYYYNNGYAHKFENSNEEYDVFLGLDSIFADLYRENKNGEIISLLKELTKSFNAPYILEILRDDFEELANLYELLGLSIRIEVDRVIVTTCMASNEQRVVELFSVESWLKQNHQEVYDSYESAIDAYTQGHAGTCIESCRTCLVSIFSKYKGTENFAKWMRGIYNTSGESKISTAQDLSQALNTELRKEDLADFFYENRAGKLTKTKAIYMIYSMMSDYGTHRNEATQENPTLEDALFSLHLMDSILFWVYSKKK